MGIEELEVGLKITKYIMIIMRDEMTKEIHNKEVQAFTFKVRPDNML